VQLLECGALAGARTGEQGVGNVDGEGGVGGHPVTKDAPWGQTVARPARDRFSDAPQIGPRRRVAGPRSLPDARRIRAAPAGSHGKPSALITARVFRPRVT